MNFEICACDVSHSIFRPFLLWRDWASTRRSHRLRTRHWHLQRAVTRWHQYTQIHHTHTYIIDTLCTRRNRHIQRYILHEWYARMKDQRVLHEMENIITTRHQHHLIHQAWSIWLHVYHTQRTCDRFSRKHALSRVIMKWRMYRAQKVRLWKAQVWICEMSCVNII